MIITSTKIIRKMVQHKVRVPPEIRELLKVNDGDEIEWDIEQDSASYRIIFKKRVLKGVVIREN